MRQSLINRMSLLAGSVLALSAGIAHAQVPVPPSPSSPPAARAAINANAGGATNEVNRLAMKIKGHDIEIIVRNGVPTYRIDGEWHGKDKWRNAADGGFIFDGPDGQPLLTLTAQQAMDMGLTRRADIPRQTASGSAFPAAPRQVRLSKQLESTTNAAGDVVLEETMDVEVRTNKGVVVALGRDDDGQAWIVREYQLDGESMPVDAHKVTAERVELFDADGKILEVIELADLNRIAHTHPAHPGASVTVSAPWAPVVLSRPRPMLGITMGAVPESLAAQLGIDSDSAVLIGSVMPGQAAEEAGLRAQDVLLWIEGENNRATFDSVREVLLSKSAGDTVELGIVRAGQPMRVKATLREGSPNEPTTGLSMSGTVSGRAFPSRDSVIEAIEAERAEIARQIQEHEARLRAMAERPATAREHDAERLSREAAEIAKRVAELSMRSAALARREHERANELVEEFVRSGRQVFRAPATPVPPQRWTFSEDEDGVLILESPVDVMRRVMPDEQTSDRLRERTSHAIDLLTRRVDQLNESLEQRLSGIDAVEPGTLRAFTQLPGTLERLERLERESAERARQIEQRLDRIERLLEELATRPR